MSFYFVLLCFYILLQRNNITCLVHRGFISPPLAMGGGGGEDNIPYE